MSKMTDKDIIKALELCKKDGNCKKCPLSNYTGCRKVLVRKALSLLCQKEATIETLKVVKKEQQAEIERLIHNLEAMAVTMRNSANATKIEAYKEFEKRVIENICAYYKDEQCVSVGTIKGFIYISSKELSSK